MIGGLPPVDGQQLLAGALQEAGRFIAWAAQSLVLSQIGLIAALGILSLWFGRALRRPLGRLTRETLPRRWVADVARALGEIAGPLLWLIALGLSAIAAQTLGLRLGLVAGATSLIAAWAAIRLVSNVALHPVWSRFISVIVWSLAALNILGLLHPLARALNALAIDAGRMHLSALSVLRALLVLAILLWLSNRFGSFLERRITRTRNLTPSLQALLVHLFRLLLPALAVVVALDALGVDLTALAVFSGAIGIGIGLGLQRLAANVIGGFVLILDKSIKPGDVVTIGETFGRVTSLGARYVSMRTRDGIEHLIPNEHFINTGVENWSHSDRFVRVKIPVSVAYDSDLRRAMDLCLDAAKAVPRVLALPRPGCLVTGFGDSAVNLEVRVWIEDPADGVANVKSAVWLEVWDRFKVAGIRIPYPQRDIHLMQPVVEKIRKAAP